MNPLYILGQMEKNKKKLVMFYCIIGAVSVGLAILGWNIIQNKSGSFIDDDPFILSLYGVFALTICIGLIWFIIWFIKRKKE